MVSEKFLKKYLINTFIVVLHSYISIDLSTLEVEQYTTSHFILEYSPFEKHFFLLYEISGSWKTFEYFPDLVFQKKMCIRDRRMHYMRPLMSIP